jgi:hypothetical protein
MSSDESQERATDYWQPCHLNWKFVPLSIDEHRKEGVNGGHIRTVNTSQTIRSQPTILKTE